MQAVVKVLGQELHYDFPPKHSRTVAELQAVLTYRNFPAKLAGKLPTRHAFVRAFRKWLAVQNSGVTSHSAAEYVDTIVEDNRKRIVFSVERAEKDKDAATVRYVHFCTVGLDKKTGQIYGSDSAVCATVQAEFPQSRERKHKADLVRLLRRLERHMIGHAVGICKFGGNFFVPGQQAAMLKRLEAVIYDLGGTVDLRQEIVEYTASQAVAGQAPAPTPNTAVSQAISDQLEEKMRDAERAFQDLFGTDWNSRKREEKKHKECSERVSAMLGDLNSYADYLSRWRDCWGDRLASLERALVDEAAYTPLKPVKIEFIPDPTDDVSVIGVELPDDAPALSDAAASHIGNAVAGFAGIAATIALTLF